MIVGKGAIADRFIEYSRNDDFLLCCGNHPDLSEISGSDFPTDDFFNITQLIKENAAKFIVYFSSTSIYDLSNKNSLYVENHLRIEKLIGQYAANYLIIRIPSIVDSGPDGQSVLNFLVTSIFNNNFFKIQEKAKVNILDIDDLFFIADYILREKCFKNQVINIANTESISIPDLVFNVETFFSKKANCSREPIGIEYSIDIDSIKPIVKLLGIKFGTDYIKRTLEKYYRHYKGIVKKVSIVVPTYFSERGIEEFYFRMIKVLSQLKSRYSFEVIFVNDGSTDNTLEKLIDLGHRDRIVKVINLSRNFGNQVAITAGIDKADSDAVVIIDDDLQDPPEIILNMIAVWENGFDVVYAVRRKRDGVGPLFRFFAKFFYRLMDYISEVKIPIDTGDFRLIDRRALKHLKEMREENRYFRGMVSWIGFKQFAIYYDRDPRYAGESNFTIKKYFKFAFDGLSSFSEKPLYISSFLGLTITFISLIFVSWIVITKLMNPQISVPGWTSMVTIMLFFGGIQLLSIGILGLYLGKVFREVKRRPLYIVESEHGFDSNER